MRARLALHSLVALLLCATPLLASWPELYQAACRVSQPGGGRGSGCAYYRDEQYIYVLTNQHVVGSARTVYCEFWRDGAKSSPLAGDVIWRHNANAVDAAVVRIPVSSFGGYVPPVIPFGADPQPGQPVVSVGCPAGSWPTLWHGRVIEVRHTVWWRPGRHTVNGYDITKGRSGSAVCTADGKRIVALLAWGDGRQEVSGGMPISRVIAAMRGQRLAAAEASPEWVALSAPAVGDPSRFTFAGRQRDDAAALARVERIEQARLDWSRGVPWVMFCELPLRHNGRPVTVQCYMLEGLRWSGWYAEDPAPQGQRMYSPTWSTLAPWDWARQAETMKGDAKRAVIARESEPRQAGDLQVIGWPDAPGVGISIGTQCPGGICPPWGRPQPQPQPPTPSPGQPWPDLPPVTPEDSSLAARVEALERRLAAAEPVVEELRRLYAEYREKWPELRAMIDATGSAKLREMAQRIEQFDRAISQVDSTVRAVDQQVQQQAAETSRLRAALEAAKERVLSPEFLFGAIERIAAVRRENPDASIKDAVVATVRSELAEVRAHVRGASGGDVAGIAAGVGIPSAAATIIGIAWAIAMRRREGQSIGPLEVLRIVREVRGAVEEKKAQ